MKGKPGTKSETELALDQHRIKVKELLHNRRGRPPKKAILQLEQDAAFWEALKTLSPEDRVKAISDRFRKFLTLSEVPQHERIVFEALLLAYEQATNAREQHAIWVDIGRRWAMWTDRSLSDPDVGLKPQDIFARLRWAVGDLTEEIITGEPNQAPKEELLPEFPSDPQGP
jgi:hypothetical protein